MKILYTYLPYIPNSLQGTGVWKKIFAQIDAFQSLGGTVYSIQNNSTPDTYDISVLNHKDGNAVNLYQDHNLASSPTSTERIWRRGTCYLFFFIKMVRYIYTENIQVIYQRYEPQISLFFICLKIACPQIKIYLEIPTFPYDQEIQSKKVLFWDKIRRLFFRFFVKRIITFSADKTIWGIPCLNITNGIPDIQTIPLAEKRKYDGKIVFTTVAMIADWHGIDRFLAGMDQAKIENVYFNVVGDGVATVVQRLKTLVSESSYLSDHVIFHGKCIGKDLDTIMSQTDIGVDALGCHRKNINSACTLKSREYTARGLPHIRGHHDYSFQKTDFSLQVQANDSSINIIEILKWYNTLNINKLQIREFAVSQFSWRKILNPIYQVLNSKNSIR